MATTRRSMDITFSRFYHCAIENGDSPIIIGGIDLHGTYFKQTEMYNLQLGQVCQLPELNIGRTNHGCAKIRENPDDLTFTLVVAGGWHKAKYTALVEILRPGSKYWSVVQPLTQWRLFTAMVINSLGKNLDKTILQNVFYCFSIKIVNLKVKAIKTHRI